MPATARETRLWEQEFKRRRVAEPAAPIQFAALIPEFVAHERDGQRVVTWRTFEKRLDWMRKAVEIIEDKATKG